MSFIIIYADKISAVSSDSEAAAYPDDNVLTAYVKEKWTADATNVATLTFTVGGGANAIGVFGSNATSIAVELNAGITWDGITWDGITWVDVEISDIYGVTDSVGTAWAVYTTEAATHTVTIKFTAAAGTVVECGKVVIGIGNTFNDIQWQPVEGLHDHSETTLLPSGGMYVYDRDCVRPFQFNVIESKVNCYTMMLSIFQANGLYIPLAMKLTDVGFEDVVYARHKSPPQMVRLTNSNFMISLDLIQEV